MVDAILHWRTPDGEWRNVAAADKTLSIDVEAYTDLDPTGENGIDRVEFYVSENGGAATTHTVSARTLRRPNYSTANSRQPGAPAGAPAPFPGYGIVLDLEALAAGTITVTCAAFSTLGTRTDHPDTLTVYNDTDGTDRRPSTKVIYLDPVNGTSGGAGTIGDPVQTLRQATSLAVANPAGSSSADRDAGGAEILVVDGMVGAGGLVWPPAPEWHTSGAWKLTVRSIGSDRTYRRTTEGIFTVPDDYVQGAGFGGGGRAHIEFQDFEIVGAGFTVWQEGTTDVIVSDRNCSSRSNYWVDDPPRPHVNYAIDDGQPTNIAVNGSGAARRYSWGHHRRGVSFGFAGYHSLFDFKLNHVLGVILQPNATEGADPCWTCGDIETLRYKPGEVDGYADTSYGFVTTGGANLSVSIPSEGLMRIEATSETTSDYGTQLDPLVGTSHWGALLSGFPSGGNNGCFPVVEAGTTGEGFPYIVVSNAGAVAETGGETARIQTGRVSNATAYNVLVHTDICQAQANLTGALFANIAVRDVRNSRGWVTAGFDMTRCAWVNLRDGSDQVADTLENDFIASALVDCLFLSCSFSSPAMSWQAGGTFTDTNFVDCAFHVAGASFPTSGVFVHSCHFESGSTHGTNPSSGDFYAFDPAASPFSMQPNGPQQGTASGLQELPDEWQWTGAGGDSRGVLRNVGAGNWAAPGAGGAGSSQDTRLALGLSLG